MIKIDKILEKINNKLIKRAAIIVALITTVSFLYPYFNMALRQTFYIIKLPGQFRQVEEDVDYLMGMTNILIDVIRANMERVDNKKYYIIDNKKELLVELRKSKSGNIYVYVPGKRKKVFAAPKDEDIDLRYYLPDKNGKQIIFDKNKN